MIQGREDVQWNETEIFKHLARKFSVRFFTLSIDIAYMLTMNRTNTNASWPYNRIPRTKLLQKQINTPTRIQPIATLSLRNRRILYMTLFQSSKRVVPWPNAS